RARDGWTQARHGEPGQLDALTDGTVDGRAVFGRAAQFVEPAPGRLPGLQRDADCPHQPGDGAAADVVGEPHSHAPDRTIQSGCGQPGRQRRADGDGYDAIAA